MRANDLSKPFRRFWNLSIRENIRPMYSTDTFRFPAFVIWMLALTGWSAPLAAQQAPQYTLFMLNPYAYNPAFAGMENTLVATGVYRQQWSNLEGAPASQQVNAHLPLFAINSGVGLKVDNDIIGAHRATQAVLSYSYQIGLGKNSALSVGGSAGFMQYVLDGNKLRAPEGTYDSPSGIFQHNDPFLPEASVTASTPVFEAGVWAVLGRMNLGAAVQPVFAPKLEASGGSFRLKPVQQTIIQGGYRFGEPDGLQIKPAFLVKTDIIETQLEISAVLQWQENIFAGASFRGAGANSKDAVTILGGFRLNEKTTLAYGYDIPLSALRDVNRGSHELLLRYSLNKPIGVGKLPPVIYNPRFF